ncbi:membrane protein [Lysinibacillus sphaericus]|uniref:YitT family protein n=1 Tax=Lysinibacillus sphaericus TaxID=1421 RepID=UPI0018CCA8C3|nr:YitT family protein [Lysinibacillus sphaericus]MBG9456512.1 membrane protein [Lysinibacillus sphaericus]MBG9479912.1 membrane protein [Lysinibacillus sphaericus]MBG9594660.1 membrane protein [Lysinibacillus sphaericus]
MKKSKSVENTRKFIMIIIGAVIAAYGLEAVLIPNEVIDGGVTGLSIMGAALFGIPLGVLLFVLNIPFIYIGYKQVGKTFALMSTAGIAALSISTVLMHDVKTILGPNDPLLIVLSGGMLLGVGIGIVLRNGGALDGSEILAVLLSRKVPFSVGDIILFINAFIFLGASFIFGLESALYSALTYFIAKNVIDIIQDGLEKSKDVRVVSAKSEEIGDAIQARLGRGVTYTKGRGGFSNEPTDILNCVINRMEENKLVSIIKDIDEGAFIVISDVSEVRGGNFKKRDIH